MNLKGIKLEDNCIICGDEPDGYTFTCEECTNALPFDFYENEAFKARVPYYISEEQRDQYMARYIRRNFKKLTRGLI